MKIKIPENFMLGTSSSAWQIEGTAGKEAGQESWAELFFQSDPSRWYDQIGPQKASDFYHRYKEDIATMASFGLNTFRFTIQWARFMKDPLKGIVDPKAVAYYQDVIKTIKSHGMKPIISLEHWDIPAVLLEKYEGWISRETLSLYTDYVKKALDCFSEEVELWFAFTEPNIPIDNGYIKQIWYPFVHDPKKAYQALFHKIVATATAVKIAKEYPKVKMGTMVHMTPVYPASDSVEDQQAAYYTDLFEVRLYLDAYCKGKIPEEIFTELEKYNCLFTYTLEDLQLIHQYPIDILGIDYYFPIRVKARKIPYDQPFSSKIYYEDYLWPKREFNADRGWEIYPKAIYDIGMRLKNEYENIDWFISENGIGIEKEGRFRNKAGIIEDDYRINFIKRHLYYTIKAKEEGCHCHGYLIWSFIDNLSAINAFKNRYGLLELDLNTYKRKPKKSLYWLKDCIEKGIVE
ncbi:glycoside hydrolase family 1 protein [Faecalicoccus pleomorphus]|uniref:glycoside hydrolase family 1 protein n=1 Tax=Faecalicoccus pleomorphus TaxID=1323 RepID=UPI0029437C51|nr:glycoside hydrolase family 1 protein [Faecalicoccus pleomorphus]